LFSSNSGSSNTTPVVASIAGAGVGAGVTYYFLSGEKKKETKSTTPKIKTHIPPVPKEIEILERRFPDFQDEIPPGYEGRIFRLSQNYPEKVVSEPLPAFITDLDFKFNPMGYMQAVRDYVYTQNLNSNWRPEDNTEGETNWFNVPWMHTGSNPREFLHGMTRERDSEPKELGDKQTKPVQNWAIGFYNKIGAYTIGQVWKDPQKPDPAAGLFKNGAVVVKILFTAATNEEVPELEGSIEWDANINSKFDNTSPKAIRKVRLLQMDIAVRDPRADSTTGWVFGTFVYDKNAPGKDGWEKMVPVGLMWGNDPGVTNPKDLKESFINPNVPAYGRRHLGENGRLNGPVDNFKSSCVSCHSTAGVPAQPLIYPDGANEAKKMHWFRNIKAGEPFEKGQIPLDYSLQLSVSIQNFQRQQNIKDVKKIEAPEMGPTVFR
jgi:hypothetical protein